MTQYIHDSVRATMMEDAPSTMQLDSGAEANQTKATKLLTCLHKNRQRATEPPTIFRLDVYVRCMSTYAHGTTTGAAGYKPIHMSHR